MRNKKSSSRFVLMLVLILALTAFPASVSASHAWGNYHWARTSNPFTVRVIDSTTSNWDDNLNVAISDWNSSSVLNVVKEAGDSSSNTRRRCRPVSGKARACNYTYGNNGWLGLAQIWITGGVHIYQATTKVNDTYLASSSYTETNRQHVICQEIGHDWGLGHQDESGADLNTCMDYDDALGNPHPNQHDYQQLETIYNSHLDSSNTSSGAAAVPPGFANADVHALENWGAKVHESANGRSAIFVRDFGKGNLIYTFVFWAK
jgi:hypothetical protein